MTDEEDLAITKEAILSLRKISYATGGSPIVGDTDVATVLDGVKVMAQYCNQIAHSMGQAEVDDSNITDILSGIGVVCQCFAKIAYAVGAD
jgi:hypothetical protein